MDKTSSGKHARTKHGLQTGSDIRGAHANLPMNNNPTSSLKKTGSIEVPTSRRPRKHVVWTSIAVLVALLALAAFAAFGPSINHLAAGTVSSLGWNTKIQAEQALETTQNEKMEGTAQTAEQQAVREKEMSFEPTIPPFDLAAADFGSIPSDTSLVGFTLNPGADIPEPSLDARVAIDGALGAITQQNACAFVFLDMQTGRGFCFNTEQDLYSASSFKAPYAFYLLQRADANGEELSEFDRNRIRASIINSDNDSYDSLHFSHDNQEFYDWLESHEITQNPALGWYPNINAKKMAQLWSEIYQFVLTGSENALWLHDLASETTVSFIRSGLEGSSASVWNKGGWIDDYDVDAVCDAGIVHASDGSEYLMVIMSDQPDGGMSHERISTLARVLFEARDSLA